MCEEDRTSVVADYVDGSLETLYRLSARELECGLERIGYFVARRPEGGFCLFLLSWLQESFASDFEESLAAMGYYRRRPDPLIAVVRLRERQMEAPE